MSTPTKSIKVPVFNEDGELVMMDDQGPSHSFDQKLRLGSQHTGIIKSEKELREHKRQVGWKEPPSTHMRCRRCHKVMIRTHATQKYCPGCGIKEKREHARARKAKERKNKRAVKE